MADEGNKKKSKLYTVNPELKRAEYVINEGGEEHRFVTGHTYSSSDVSAVSDAEVNGLKLLVEKGGE